MNYQKELLARYRATVDELNLQKFDQEVELAVINEAIFSSKLKTEPKLTEKLQEDAKTRTQKIQALKDVIALQEKKVERLLKWQKTN